MEKVETMNIGNVETAQAVEKDLHIVDALTNTGRMKNAVRDDAKVQVHNEFLQDFEKAGDYYVKPILIDSDTGKTVYARLELVITADDNFAKKKKGTKGKAEPIVPKLFG